MENNTSSNSGPPKSRLSSKHCSSLMRPPMVRSTLTWLWEELFLYSYSLHWFWLFLGLFVFSKLASEYHHFRRTYVPVEVLGTLLVGFFSISALSTSNLLTRGLTHTLLHSKVKWKAIIQDLGTSKGLKCDIIRFQKDETQWRVGEKLARQIHSPPNLNLKASWR